MDLINRKYSRNTSRTHLIELSRTILWIQNNRVENWTTLRCSKLKALSLTPGLIPQYRCLSWLLEFDLNVVHIPKRFLYSQYQN
ncbi:hypothetical protein T03_2185 [Trichinella britovi]|uniref:Uncharacterized protein n=1 Tax=Trichinella britovi TaxID=45882 RepID=A0A0V1C3C0_TRIBR|nr:hypothetical protein T03_2185 [Trichinella britovi]